jgi:hypothetical protein
MEELTFDDLDEVHGGETTTISTPVGSYTNTRSNYESCLRNVQTQASAAHPDTRNIVQQWFGFGTDQNGPARAGYMRDNIPRQCGLPPAG